MSMTSSRPYMIRALYEWIVDNNCKPYILVDAHASNVQVPQQYVNKEGQIVLNISPDAVLNLTIDNTGIFFNAKFGGIPTDISVPSHGILGIYARENGQGMIFEPESDPEPPPASPDPDNSNTGGKKPSLRVVK